MIMCGSRNIISRFVSMTALFSDFPSLLRVCPIVDALMTRL